MQSCISFRSRSDLVLDADHALDFYPISFYRRVSRFVVFQTKWRIFVVALFTQNAVAQMNSSRGLILTQLFDLFTNNLGIGQSHTTANLLAILGVLFSSFTANLEWFQKIAPELGAFFSSLLSSESSCFPQSWANNLFLNFMLNSCLCYCCYRF